MTREQREKKGSPTLRADDPRTLTLREGDELERYKAFLEEEKITMTPAQHQAMMRKMWPGLKGMVNEAIGAGRPVKMSMQRTTHLIENKDQAKKMGVKGDVPFVWQSPYVTISLVVDTGKEVTSTKK